MDELQKKVGSSYNLYGDFKRTVILIAQRDLEKHTDICFEFEELKTGKKVDRLKFYIQANIPQEARKPDPLLLELFPPDHTKSKCICEISTQVRMAMLALGISENTVQKIVSQGFKFIEAPEKRKSATEQCKTFETWLIEKLILVEKEKSVLVNDNPGGYFINALKQDWGSRSSTREIKKKQIPKRSLRQKIDRSTC